MTEPLGIADKSLSDQIHEYLRKAIIEGAIAPGTWLRERELAEQLDVSRIPVREALPQLESEGFVDILPRRGAIVRQLTLREVEELFDIRERLEVLAAESAARRALHEPPTVIELAHAKASSAVAAQDRDQITMASLRFHEAVIEFSGNNLLQSIMKSINGRVEWVFRLTSFERPHTQQDEHETLLDAIRHGDDRLASAVAYVHIARGRASSIEALRPILPAAVEQDGPRAGRAGPADTAPPVPL